jgi:aspartyl-tRNA(Asn)/glutamyl-tRNA(Gln) amidotransferase subunit A
LDPTPFSLIDAVGHVASGDISPIELATAHLERIASLDPRLGAFIAVHEAEAMRSAQEAERADGHRPLRGIPIALKDLYDVRGTPTTAGSSFFRNAAPAVADATTVARLRDAGAVFLGKLNLHECALGVTGVNPHFGPCRNPWDLARIAGGSSSGSATALAAGLCMGSLGSDTGGSIRIPASLCGIVGLKPTSGRVSLRGVVPLSWTLDHAGPMARTVADAALMLQVIAGYDREDPSSIDVPVEDYQTGIDRGVNGWRIALADVESIGGAEREVADAVNDAARVFERLGAQIEIVRLADIPDAARANSLITTSDGAAFHAERLEHAPEGFGHDVLTRLRRGAGYSSREHAEARRTRTIIRRRLESLFRRHGGAFDILLTPTTPCTAMVREGLDPFAAASTLTRFTSPFNLTGLPALSIPCGFSTEGLPIGLQLVGARWDERGVLRAGHAFEQATTWHTRRPTLSETAPAGHT